MQALAAIPFGLGIGLSLGTLGGGGSVLAVPVLVYILGQSVHQATTTSLVVVTAGAVVGGLSHAREQHVCWRHALAFTAAALPGVIAGTALGQEVSGKALLVAFAIIMMAAGIATWRKARTQSDSPPPAAVPATCPPLRLGLDLGVGLAVGAMTGFFGVGGGFLIVPALTIALALSMRLAIGTSLLIITLTSILALAAHLAVGRTISVGIMAAMTAACVVGATAGARIAQLIPQRRLGTAFAGLVVLVAAYLLVSAAFLGGPPGGA